MEKIQISSLLVLLILTSPLISNAEEPLFRRVHLEEEDLGLSYDDEDLSQKPEMNAGFSYDDPELYEELEAEVEPAPAEEPLYEELGAEVEPTPAEEPLYEELEAEVEPTPAEEPLYEELEAEVEPAPAEEPLYEELEAEIIPAPAEEPLYEELEAEVEPAPAKEPLYEELEAEIIPAPAEEPLHEELEAEVTPAPAQESPPPVVIRQIVISPGEGTLTVDEALNVELHPFIGSLLTEETVLEIKRTIVRHYKERHNHLVAVTIPDQEISEGTLALTIIQPLIEKIEYTGQQWTKVSFLKSCIGAECGDRLDEALLLNGVAWFNNHPFHQSEVVLAPGVIEGSTTVEVKTKEKFPIRFYAGADNTGIHSCDQVRLFGGVAWGNAMWVGDLMTYQYTASPDFRQFQSHLVQYTSFLSWHHFLVAYAGYSTIFPQIVGFSSSGKSAQLSMRYLIPFKPFYTNFKQQLGVGFDIKYLNNNLFYVAEASNTIVTQQSINISQFYFSYQWQQKFSIHSLTAKADIYFSPWSGFLANQTSQDYNNLRYHSRVHYFYTKIAFRHGVDLPADWAFIWLIRGQAANSTLPVSEQFALGGYDTVRGYQERPFLADDAFCANIELHTPRFAGFLFLAFWDYGVGYNYHVQAANQKIQWLMGMGPGVRYDRFPYVSVRCDYAFQLHDLPNDTHFGRFHLGITASY